MLVEVICRVGYGWPEVAQQACAAAAWDLPDAEEAQNMVYSVRMEVPAFAHENHAGWQLCLIALNICPSGSVVLTFETLLTAVKTCISAGVVERILMAMDDRDAFTAWSSFPPSCPQRSGSG